MADLNVEKVAPENQKSYKVTIKKETIILTVNKSDLIEVKETGDGMVFNLKGGLYFTLMDMRMPLEVKRAISTAVNRFKAANLVIDLMNYVHPVSVTTD